MLRHADVAPLLTVARFLSHDYLERLEAAAPGLREAGPGRPAAARAADAAASRRVGRSATAAGRPPDRRWIRARRRRPRPRRTPSCARSRHVVTPGRRHDPDLQLRQHRRSEGRRPHPRQRDPPRLQPESGSATSAPTTASARRCPSSGWAASSSHSLGGMHVGATMVCEEAFEPGETLRFLERERVTIAAGWPHYAQGAGRPPQLRKDRDLSSLRAGNLLRTSCPRRWRRRIPSCGAATRWA